MTITNRYKYLIFLGAINTLNFSKELAETSNEEAVQNPMKLTSKDRFKLTT
jgi:hypothetical protein